MDNALTLFVGDGMHKGYTDEVHECFMDISQYVSAKNISKVVTSILLQYREDSRVMIAGSKYRVSMRQYMPSSCLKGWVLAGSDSG